MTWIHVNLHNPEALMLLLDLLWRVAAVHAPRHLFSTHTANDVVIG